ncbi:alpha-L-rhamnosidase [Actinoplanes lutulentus]|uniref:alpha-L-rhamnosidase n=1 Tax=Actinoplanes lutulentus TaxID=1287878 RepID=A0A327ZCC6_9ACTN|nr:alpha-L-rhamnosidase [Actinoplanes lutulentus]MBB2947330.1 alpha-L-rhamnosidase [Actinoplanes lutulentus]RAK36605.1 alpha-L-rhamnosidase [Actinoplanes lutulentus]
MTGAPIDLRTDTRVAPVGIDNPRPEFAWRPAPGAGPQTKYAVQVSAGAGFGPGDLIWDSGPAAGAQPFGIVHGGPALASAHAYRWRVRTWDDQDRAGLWSEPATFETGILDPARWRARWISGPAPASTADYQVVYLRTVVEVPSAVVRGRAYVSALGWYRFFVNGVDLTGPALVPRWTPFDTAVEYQTYDITDAVTTGRNVLAMAVADGRFRGRNGGHNVPAVYGDRLAGFAQIELDLADGSRLLLTTDETWKAGAGRIRTADPKFGEQADQRISDDDWHTGETTPARFSAAWVLDQPRTLIAEEVARVQQVHLLPARTVTRTPSGKQIVDFGQNFAGVVRIRLTGPAGARIGLTHSEVLRDDGELDVDYLFEGAIGKFQQRDEVLLGSATTTYQPWFTIHGFRYLEVDGLPGDLDPTSVDGIVLSSDLPASGSFDCSDPRLNQLYGNVGWSLRSNFVDTPTDCPTRERSGWTGDIQVFAPTATTYVDAQSYLRRYLRNLATEQLPDGRIPIFIPAEGSTFSGGLQRAVRAGGGSIGWGDAAVLLPWTLYRYYGDRTVLERGYPAMTAWVDHLASKAYEHRSLRRRLRGTGRSDIEQHILDTGFHFGEWLRPGTGALGSVVDSYRRGSVVNTAYLEHSARTLSTIAALLGHDPDAARYRRLADRTRHAWRTVFLAADGRIGSDRQDDYVRALAFDLLEPGERPAAVARLVTLIEQAGDHLGTGFLSTPMLLPALADGGRPDVVWRLLLQNTSPSWLYQVECGATTVWESWEGHKPDGRAHLSHNHYALGAVAGFLTERVAGLTPGEPGYRVIDIQPLIGGGLTHACATLRTPFGTATSGWTRDADQVHLEVTVPPGATARVRTGRDGIHHVGSGTHVFEWKQVIA